MKDINKQQENLIDKIIRKKDIVFVDYGMLGSEAALELEDVKECMKEYTLTIVKKAIEEENKHFSKLNVPITEAVLKSLLYQVKTLTKED